MSDNKEVGYNDPHASLSSWVIGRVTQWEDHRNVNYLEKWDEYYRLWRGTWSAADKNRASENSRLIAPATQQAIESIVAELEEAVFGQEKWFDLRDDLNDQDPTDVKVIRSALKEDLERAHVKDSVVECLLNAAIYGTGIAKISVDEEVNKTM